MPSRGAEQPKRPGHLISKESRGDSRLGSKWLLKSLLTGVLALAAGVYWASPSVETTLGYFRPIGQDSYWGPHRQEVKDAFVTSWDAYTKYAWGKLPALCHVVIAKMHSCQFLSLNGQTLVYRKGCV